MERVTFLVERTGERIPCLLNPEGLEVRRAAGIARRRSAGGVLIGNPRTDDPLLATGGGVTEYELKLLFDVDLLASGGAAPTSSPAAPVTVAPAGENAGGSMASLGEVADAATDDVAPVAEAPDSPADGDSASDGDTVAVDLPPVADSPVEAPAEAASAPPVQPQPVVSIDVRTLTQPLWALAENGEPVGGRVAPTRVRFIWGRSWNVPGVILAVAERLERFDAEGVPKRSWLNLKLRRVEEQLEGSGAPPAPTSPQFEINARDLSTDELGDDSVIMPVDETGVPLGGLHLVAAEHCGDPRWARAIAEYNDIDDMFQIDEGRPIRLPPFGPAAAQV